MTERPETVLCVGRLYCDLIFTGAPGLPTAGTETFAKGLCMDIGGGAFIAAATLAALGRPAALMAMIPSAPFADFVMQDPLFDQLDTRRCAQTAAEFDPQITVAITTDSDRAFLSRKSGPALPPVQADHFDGIRHLHIGELRTLVEHPELIDLAQKSDVSISLDCGWDEDLFDAGKDLAALISAVDLFLPNEHEAARLDLIGVPLPEATTVIKTGAQGAHLVRAGRKVQADAPKVPVIDTTGAGDAFNAGFLNAWLNSASDIDCLASGIACGSAGVQHAGGTGALRQPLVKATA